MSLSAVESRFGRRVIFPEAVLFAASEEEENA